MVLSFYGIENDELPMIQFTMRIDGGLQALDPEGKEGVALLLGSMLKEGTKARTPIELEEAIDLLGSSISLSVGLRVCTFQEIFCKKL